jgi:AcrR family transcriptional regulator
MSRKVDPEAQRLTMERFMRAGIEAIAEKGIDNVTVQYVSEKAKSSRPTFYSYFGDINGLLAETWIFKAPMWLEDISNPLVSPSKLTKHEQRRHLAMSEILAAAHRIPEVLEVVQPVMADWWARFEKKSELEKLQVLWLVAERLGVSITSRVDSLVQSAEFIEPAINALSSIKLPEVKGKATLPKLVGSTSSDETMDMKLLNSAIDVISRGGVNAASMARVARRAHVSTGVMYPRFSGIDSLIENSFEHAVAGVIAENFDAVTNSGFTEDDFGILILAGLQPTREVWRNFRIEIHLGAKGRSNLTKRIQANLRETNLKVASKLHAVKNQELASGPVPYLMHAVGIGFAVLLNAGVPVDKPDHRIITKGLTHLINSQ